jgi:HSF-type DNA-binding
LIEILGKEEISDVISWLPHGKGFLIYKKKKFALEVLPKYFKQAKFTSFTRKLNRWGFSRVTRGPETGAYYHKLFQRGDLRLCMQMSCQTTKQAMSSLTFANKANKNMPNVFAPQEPDLTQQSENIIRQQLHQLQLQQSEFYLFVREFLICFRCIINFLTIWR